MDICTKSDNQILILFDLLIFIKGLFHEPDKAPL